MVFSARFPPFFRDKKFPVQRDERSLLERTSFPTHGSRQACVLSNVYTNIIIVRGMGDQEGSKEVLGSGLPPSIGVVVGWFSGEEERACHGMFNPREKLFFYELV